MVLNITKDNFEAEVLKSDKPVLVDFWAEWCVPCKMLAPTMEEIAEERDDIKVCKINIDNEPQLAAQFAIMTIPTVMAFGKGETLGKTVGVQSKEEILNLI